MKLLCFTILHLLIHLTQISADFMIFYLALQKNQLHLNLHHLHLLPHHHYYYHLHQLHFLPLHHLLLHILIVIVIPLPKKKTVLKTAKLLLFTY